MRQTRLRAQSHAVADRRPVEDTGDRRATAEMTGNHPQRRAVHRRPSIIDVQVASTLNHVFAIEQFRRALGDKFVARAVKTPTANTRVVPALRHRVARRGLRHPLIKRRLKQPNQRHAWHLLGEQPDSPDVRRVVRRGDVVTGLHRVHNLRRQFETAGTSLGHDGLETYCGQIILGSNPVARPKLAEQLLDRPGMVAHPLQPATRQ